MTIELGIESQGSETQGTESQGSSTPTPQTQESQGPSTQGTETQGVENPLSEALFQQLGEEYEREGALSATSYETLAKQGISKHVVDVYLQGLNLQVENITRKVYEISGGEEGYRKAQEWAKKHWDMAQQEAFNKAVHSGDESLMLLAVQGLTSQYGRSHLKEPNLVQGSRPQGTNPSGGLSVGSQGQGPQGLPGTFESTAQLMAAMRDPRYGQDEAYREQVKAVLNHSRIL